VSEHERVEELRHLRQLMGTAPEVAPPLETRFYRGVEGIRVDLLEASTNPYRAIYAMATSTWGTWKTSIVDRWLDASPEARLAVVRAVLEHHALPLAMEAPQFTFTVENLSRWSFDQLARARLGVVFASMGTRDNNHKDLAFRFHEATFRGGRAKRFAQLALEAKRVYAETVDAGAGSWQEARTALPICCVHRFTFSINYAALRNLCASRMTFSEAEDTVAVAWLLRDRLLQADAFPLLGAYLRPACDYAGACRYHRAHTMSEAFGCLFRSCGRNPVKSAPGNPSLDYEVATFNESCSDRQTISAQLGIHIPCADEDRPETFEPAPRDRWLLGFRPRSEEEAVLFRRFANVFVDPTVAPFTESPSGVGTRPRTLEDLLP
jgi:thymidylate synthase ThyX